MGKQSVSTVEKDTKAQYTEEELASRWAPAQTKTQNLTIEKLESFMPKGSNIKLTQAILDEINRVEDSTGMDQGLFEEQLCSYMHLLGPGISFEKLMNAIKFVTLRQIAGNQANAYRIVFPDKSDEIEGRGQKVDSFASMYAQSKAVVEVQKLNMIGLHITFRPLANQIVQKYMNLMNGIGANPDDYVSPTVQLNATIAAMDAIKPPEDNTMELKIGMSDNVLEAQQNVAIQLAENARLMREQFQQGKSLDSIQRLGVVVQAEVIDDEG